MGNHEHAQFDYMNNTENSRNSHNVYDGTGWDPNYLVKNGTIKNYTQCISSGNGKTGWRDIGTVKYRY